MTYHLVEAFSVIGEELRPWLNSIASGGTLLEFTPILELSEVKPYFQQECHARNTFFSLIVMREGEH